MQSKHRNSFLISRTLLKQNEFFQKQLRTFKQLKMLDLPLPINDKRNQFTNKIAFIRNRYQNSEKKVSSPLEKLKKFSSIKKTYRSFSRNESKSDNKYIVNAITVDLLKLSVNQETMQKQQKKIKKISEKELLEKYFSKKMIEIRKHKLYQQKQHNLSVQVIPHQQLHTPNKGQDQKLFQNIQKNNNRQRMISRKNTKIQSILDSIKQFELRRNIDVRSRSVFKRNINSNEWNQQQSDHNQFEDLLELKHLKE